MLIFTAGCHKNDASTPEVVPQAMINFNRSILYLDNDQRIDTTYTTPELKAQITQYADNLSISISPVNNNEKVFFLIDRKRMSAELTGTYTLKTLLDENLDSEVRYFYVQPDSLGGGTIIYPGNTQHVKGSFTISSYDSRRKILSGIFSATMAGTNDPTVSYFAYPKRKCDITVTGIFNNIPVVTAQ